MSVFLNKLVMNVVSFPTYVNVAHLCVCVCVCVWIVSVLSVLGGVVSVVLLGRSCCTECCGLYRLVGIRLLVSHMCSVCYIGI